MANPILVNPFIVTIGWLCVGALLVGIAYIVKEKIDEKLYVFKARWKLKHRFDKPPTAKCYCAECVRWKKTNNETEDSHAVGYCRNVSKYTADFDFCSDAYKKSNDDILREGKCEKEV